MIWMYVGVSIIIFIGSILIIQGFKLTKANYKEEKYINGTAIYNVGIVESVVLFLLTLLFKYIPFWLMRGVLILFGLVIIMLGILILLFG
ncbi:hypothetical protein HF078_15985 [Bacillus sp. RO2]|uniref:hypothetical protein n=1 Tax=Bacillus sp. RO2 TaxID=2723913 RepID=UPI00145DA2BC|nr:hypothetical protein [Bacillus sp. RO2]NMH74586.1 hypothetical protein [Bacillus sp. RO2]